MMQRRLRASTSKVHSLHTRSSRDNCMHGLYWCEIGPQTSVCGPYAAEHTVLTSPALGAPPFFDDVRREPHPLASADVPWHVDSSGRNEQPLAGITVTGALPSTRYSSAPSTTATIPSAVYECLATSSQRELDDTRITSRQGMTRSLRVRSAHLPAAAPVPPAAPNRLRASRIVATVILRSRIVASARPSASSRAAHPENNRRQFPSPGNRVALMRLRNSVSSASGTFT
jgi:hypothetical protein